MWITALSIDDPGPKLFGSNGPAIGRLVHGFLAEITRTLPLQDMSASLREADRCASVLGMKRILLYSDINGEISRRKDTRSFARNAPKRSTSSTASISWRR